MRRAALSMMILLGTAILAEKAHAGPALSAPVAVERSTVLVSDRRPHRHWHSGFHRGQAFHRHGARGGHHRPAFAGKRLHRAPVVIVRPVHRRSFVFRHQPFRPLLRSGSFAWRAYYW